MKKKYIHIRFFSPLHILSEYDSITKTAHFENTDPVTSCTEPMFTFGVPVEGITGYQEI